MYITVARKHIKGANKQGDGCPAALALQGAGFANAFVQTEMLWLGGYRWQLDEGDYGVSTPLDVAEFIWAHDADELVEPFTFELDI